MRNGSGSKALLIELLIVILFFMIAATVLLQLFAAARSLSARAELLEAANNEAQNIAERLYAAEDPEETLRELGFTEDAGSWMRTDEAWTAVLSAGAENTAAGVIRSGEICLYAGEEALITLPWARYEEAAA